MTLDQGWFRGKTRGNAVPIVIMFKNAQKRNAAVKDKETFYSSVIHACFHFTFTFTSDNSIREK